MRRRLTVLVAMAVMVVMMVANAGMASAQSCAPNCEPPPPPGASNTTAFAHANPNAYDALLNNALKRQGPK